MPTNFARIPALLCLLTVPFIATGLRASEQQTCTIEYEIHNLPDPAGNVDTDPDHKEFSACVRDLEDCNRRAAELARANEMAAFDDNADVKPDLGSIRVVSTRTEEGCEAPE